MIHFRSQRLFINAGLCFPQCYSNASLLDTDKGRLQTTPDESKVTCGHCRNYLGLSNRFSLRRVRLNSQGYTDKGVYFGVGMPLWEYSDYNGDNSDHIRAYDRTDAKSVILARHPGATFSR